MTKDLWVHCPSSMFSNTCTVLYFYILSHLLFSSLNPVSTNLIHNLKRSLIYELSLLTLFSVVMLCLWQFPVLLCKFPVSLGCCQVPLLPLEWPYFQLAILLCKIFTFIHNIRYCFLFLATHCKSDDWVVLPIFCFIQFVRIACSCAPHNMASVSTFKSAVLSQLMFVFSFVVSGVLSLQTFHAFFCFSMVPLFPHPTLFEFLLIYCTVIFYCSFDQRLNWSLDIPSQLSPSILTNTSQLINSLPPISPLRYTLST